MNQYNKTIMHRLWRRDSFKLSTPDFNSTRKKEPVFVENLGTAIKVFKKKEDFYIKAFFTDLSQERPMTSKSELKIRISCETRMSYLQQEHEQLLGEEDSIMQTLKKYEKQAFFQSKNYLYTVFVRLTEALEGTKQKINHKIKFSEVDISKDWQEVYGLAKQALADCYQNLIYFQKYDILQLLAMAKRKQNQRIYGVVPPKNRKIQIILNPIPKAQSSKLMKTSSLDLTSQKSKINDIISKKLNKKEKKLQTQKRKQSRTKPKKKKEVDPFKYLYGILNLKPNKLQNNFFLRRQMELQAIERNFSINEARKNWERNCAQKAIVLKLSKVKKN